MQDKLRQALNAFFKIKGYDFKLKLVEEAWVKKDVSEKDLTQARMLREYFQNPNKEEK